MVVSYKVRSIFIDLFGGGDCTIQIKVLFV